MAFPFPPSPTDGQERFFNVATVPCDPGNRDYAEFVSSGATAAPYVAPPAPPAPPEPTAEEKLAATGLTVEDFQALLSE